MKIPGEWKLFTFSHHKSSSQCIDTWQPTDREDTMPSWTEPTLDQLSIRFNASKSIKYATPKWHNRIYLTPNLVEINTHVSTLHSVIRKQLSEIGQTHWEHAPSHMPALNAHYWFTHSFLNANSFQPTPDSFLRPFLCSRTHTTVLYALFPSIPLNHPFIHPTTHSTAHTGNIFFTQAYSAITHSLIQSLNLSLTRPFTH